MKNTKQTSKEIISMEDQKLFNDLRVMLKFIPGALKGLNTYSLDGKNRKMTLDDLKNDLKIYETKLIDNYRELHDGITELFSLLDAGDSNWETKHKEIISTLDDYIKQSPQIIM